MVVQAPLARSRLSRAAVTRSHRRQNINAARDFCSTKHTCLSHIIWGLELLTRARHRPLHMTGIRTRTHDVECGVKRRHKTAAAAAAVEVVARSLEAHVLRPRCVSRYPYAPTSY